MEVMGSWVNHLADGFYADRKCIDRDAIWKLWGPGKWRGGMFRCTDTTLMINDGTLDPDTTGMIAFMNNELRTYLLSYPSFFD
jgi:hypothetical protein